MSFSVLTVSPALQLLPEEVALIEAGGTIECHKHDGGRYLIYAPDTLGTFSWDSFGFDQGNCLPSSVDSYLLAQIFGVRPEQADEMAWDYEDIIEAIIRRALVRMGLLSASMSIVNVPDGHDDIDAQGHFFVITPTGTYTFSSEPWIASVENAIERGTPPREFLVQEEP